MFALVLLSQSDISSPFMGDGLQEADGTGHLRIYSHTLTWHGENSACFKVPFKVVKQKNALVYKIYTTQKACHTAVLTLDEVRQGSLWQVVAYPSENAYLKSEPDEGVTFGTP